MKTSNVSTFITCSFHVVCYFQRIGCGSAMPRRHGDALVQWGTDHSYLVSGSDPQVVVLPGTLASLFDDS